MVEHVKVVRTQASQLWLSRNVADLGWPPALNGRCYGERAVFGTYIEPLDTWADMSQLIPLEDVGRAGEQRRLLLRRDERQRPAEHRRRARELTRTLLEQHMYLAWTYAATPGNVPLRLAGRGRAGRERSSDEERFRRQYFRVNTEPTELYVLSVSGSTKYRLDPADSGYANLSLAGDWVATGSPSAASNPQCWAAMKGVQRFCPGWRSSSKTHDRIRMPSPDPARPSARIEVLYELGARRDGRRLSRGARGRRSRGGAQDAVRGDVAISSAPCGARSTRSAGCAIPASCASSMKASSRACRGTRWSSSTACSLDVAAEHLHGAELEATADPAVRVQVNHGRLRARRRGEAARAAPICSGRSR